MKLMDYAKEIASSIIANQKSKENKEILEAKPVEIVDVRPIEEPGGKIEQFFDLNVDVTSEISEIFREHIEHLPWTSFDFTNNGPDPVYISVNKWMSPQAPIVQGRSINIDFKHKHAIKRVYLKCDPGNIANVSFHIIK